MKTHKKKEKQANESNAYVARTKALYLDSFIKNKLTGNYHATRCQALLKQIEDKEFGMWNGIVYNEACLSAEYWLAKHSAIKSFAAAQIAMGELKKVGVTEEEVYTHFRHFQDSQIFSDDYADFMDDTDDKTAKFVEEQ